MTPTHPGGGSARSVSRRGICAARYGSWRRSASDAANSSVEPSAIEAPECARGRERGVTVLDPFWQGSPCRGGRDGRLRYERDRGSGWPVGEACDPAVPGQADATGQYRGEVVGVALELDARGEQLLRIEGPTGHGAGCEQPECDHGRAGAETALARDAIHELKPPSVGRRGARRRVRRGGPPRVSLGHLELVPEVERDRGAVESRADVGRARRRADPCEDTHEVASRIAWSGSTSTGGGRSCCRLGVLEPVAGDHTDDPSRAGQPGPCECCEPRRGGGLAEEPFARRELTPGLDDLVVGERDNLAL